MLRRTCNPGHFVIFRMFMNSNSYKGNTATHRMDLTAMNLPNWKETSYPPDRLWAWKVLEARMDNCDCVEFAVNVERFQVQGLEPAFWEWAVNKDDGVSGLSDPFIHGLASG